MDINRGAPATAEGEIHIAADPQTVWDVIAAIDGWPSWNRDVTLAKLQGPLAPGSVFRWKAGVSLTSTLRVVDPPREIGWTGRATGVRAVHVFRFEPKEGGTVARSAESFEGLIPSLFRGYSRRMLDRGIQDILARLKSEAERRTRA
jgi:uncharacterized protein YndB with AHSA1/START domain